jgi:carboxyl-terminal processing protease
LSNDGRSRFGSGLVTGIVFGVLAAALAGFVLGLYDDDGAGDAVGEARSVIRDNYFEPVSDEQLDEGSINGMVDDVKKANADKFSHYFTAEQLDDFEASTSGRFEGVGLTVTEVPRGLRVAAVLPDSPAKEAGIEKDDVITRVDGKSIAGVSSDISTARIKGPPGTEVDLTIVSGETGKSREMTVERASVRLPAVRGQIRREGGRKVAYVQFATFSEGAHGELRNEIERLYREGAEGLVLDLRGNGGGLLNEAILSASIFVEEGVIVSTTSRTQGDRDYDAVGGALDPRPTVVLVNRDSASAAEIVTAALQVYDAATVVGTRTYGKGTFQEVIPLDNGGALDLTVGEYLTRDGTSINGTGVKPQVKAKDVPSTKPDEGLERALQVLGKQL